MTVICFANFGWCLFSVSESCIHRAAEQSVHLTGGILRHLQALSALERNPVLEVLSRPAYTQVTHATGRLLWYERRH